jgi:hypothetical protein
MTATEMASDLTDRIEHAGDKLRKLELVTRPARKKAPKKRSKLGMFTVVALIGGFAYAMYRMLRDQPMTEPITSGRDLRESDTGVAPSPRPAVRTA